MDKIISNFCKPGEHGIHYVAIATIALFVFVRSISDDAHACVVLAKIVPKQVFAGIVVAPLYVILSLVQFMFYVLTVLMYM